MPTPFGSSLSKTLREVLDKLEPNGFGGEFGDGVDMGVIRSAKRSV